MRNDKYSLGHAIIRQKETSKVMDRSGASRGGMGRGAGGRRSGEPVRGRSTGRSEKSSGAGHVIGGTDVPRGGFGP